MSTDGRVERRSRVVRCTRSAGPGGVAHHADRGVRRPVRGEDAECLRQLPVALPGCAGCRRPSTKSPSAAAVHPPLDDLPRACAGRTGEIRVVVAERRAEQRPTAARAAVIPGTPTTSMSLAGVLQSRGWPSRTRPASPEPISATACPAGGLGDGGCGRAPPPSPRPLDEHPGARAEQVADLVEVLVEADDDGRAPQLGHGARGAAGRRRPARARRRRAGRGARAGRPPRWPSPTCGLLHQQRRAPAGRRAEQRRGLRRRSACRPRRGPPRWGCGTSTVASRVGRLGHQRYRRARRRRFRMPASSALTSAVARQRTARRVEAGLGQRPVAAAAATSAAGTPRLAPTPTTSDGGRSTAVRSSSGTTRSVTSSRYRRPRRPRRWRRRSGAGPAAASRRRRPVGRARRRGAPGTPRATAPLHGPAEACPDPGRSTGVGGGGDHRSGVRARAATLLGERVAAAGVAAERGARRAGRPRRRPTTRRVGALVGRAAARAMRTAAPTARNATTASHSAQAPRSASAALSASTSRACGQAAARVSACRRPAAVAATRPIRAGGFRWFTGAPR